MLLSELVSFVNNLLLYERQFFGSGFMRDHGERQQRNCRKPIFLFCNAAVLLLLIMAS